MNNEERLRWAARQLEDCRICPRQCGVNRLRGERGWCGAGADVRYFMEFIHYGEEAEFVPSHVIYLTGCNLGCPFCHTAKERESLPSKPLDIQALETLAASGSARSARNMNFLGGEPVVNLPGLLRLFIGAKTLPPVVWNTNLYCSGESLEMLDGLAYNYLADLKAGNSCCGAELTGAADYFDCVKERLLELHVRSPERLIVRHLVLPGHIDCCMRPALKWLAQNLPRAKVSLKLDYLVMPAARSDARLQRFLSKEEIEEARSAAKEAGVTLTQEAPEPKGTLTENPQGKPLDVEMVISPDGRLFLRHPTIEAIQFGREVERQFKEEKK